MSKEASEVESASSPFAVPIFRSVWVASLISNFGILVLSVGASWLMTSLTTSRQLVALVQGATSLPIMLLALLAGALADNFDRRKVMLCAQASMLIVSVPLVLVAWLGCLSPWSLLGFIFLIGCGTALYAPSWQASVGDMVPRQLLPTAIAYNSMGFNVARTLGPALGGFIVAAGGVAGAFLFNALSYIPLLSVLFRWKAAESPRLLPREGLGPAVASGIRYVAMSPHLRYVLLRSLLFSVAAVTVPALLALVARDLITGGPLAYGILLACFGSGAVVGALVAQRMRKSRSSEWLAGAAALLLASGMLVIGISRSMVPTMVAVTAAGVGWVTALSTFNVLVQLAAPRWVIGRAVALFQMFAFGGMAAGSWLFGAAAEKVGISGALYLATVFQLIGALVGRFKPLPEVMTLNLDPVSGWSEPEPGILINPTSGPIAIQIEYRIDAEDMFEFIALMNERKRLRSRDGARDWSLMRDLADGELWIERYQVPTWVDYIRHLRRRTQADLHNYERVTALHRGGELPRIRRMIDRRTSTELDRSYSGAETSVLDVTGPHA